MLRLGPRTTMVLSMKALGATSDQNPLYPYVSVSFVCSSPTPPRQLLCNPSASSGHRLEASARGVGVENQVHSVHFVHSVHTSPPPPRLHPAGVQRKSYCNVCCIFSALLNPLFGCCCENSLLVLPTVADYKRFANVCSRQH